MAKRGLLLASAVTVAFLIPGCSDDGDTSGGNGNDSGGTGGALNNGDFRDTDGDGQLDPIQPTEFGEGAVPITEAEVDAMRNAACTGWSAEPEPMGSNLFFVVDASSSMDATANGTGDESKWVVTRDALINTVETFPDDTMIGLLGYPNKPIDAEPSEDHSSCVNLDELVPVGLLGSNNFRQTVVDGLMAIETETCTPTHDAYVVALEEYTRSAALGQKYILLMTDGTPTLSLGCQPGSCSSEAARGSDREIIAEIERARTELNIKTFVLGSPGSELHMETGEDNRPWLSEAAEVGGTAQSDCTHSGPNYCHFDMTQAADFDTALKEALTTIAGKVVACDYALPLPPDGETIDSGAINLIVTPDGGKLVKLLRAPSPDCSEGWYYDAATQRVLLCSESCDLAQSDPNLSIELMFGCASTEIVR